MKNRKSTTTFASYRLFMLLKILFENKATVKDIVVYLEKIDPTNKTYSDITVYKYLNSLRSMDFDLVRDEQNRYTITKLPYTFKFPKEVLSVLKSINDYTSFIEETTVKNNLSNFISMIKKRLNDEDVDYFEHVKTENITTERVYTQKELELIKNFERNVKENFKICISYKEDKSTVKRLIVSPVSIEYKENKVYFVVSDSAKCKNIFLELEKIIEIEQLPQKAVFQSIPVTVLYEISGRLKRRYVLKSNETLASSTEDTAVIINKGEDKDKLIKRLIGYCDLCKIISPKEYKEDLLNEVENMLNLYE